MTRLDPAAVLAVSQAWVYVPPDARDVPGDGFRVIAYPTTWAYPTMVNGIDSDRPASEVVDAVLDTVADLGRDRVWLWTHPETRPADLVEHLLARGAVLEEELAVLARPLAGPGDLPDLPDLAVPDDVEVRVADSLEVLRDADRVGVEVFGGGRCSDVELAEQLARADLATGLSLVGYRDGEAVATAGLTLREDAACLWGGAVLEPARGTGAYRALVAHRLALGVEHGCSMALTKGRLATSAPVLRRAGFEAYGSETSYRL